MPCVSVPTVRGHVFTFVPHCCVSLTRRAETFCWNAKAGGWEVAGSPRAGSRSRFRGLNVKRRGNQRRGRVSSGNGEGSSSSNSSSSGCLMPRLNEINASVRTTDELRFNLHVRASALRRPYAGIRTGCPARLCHENSRSAMFAGTGTTKFIAYVLTTPSRT